MNRFVCKYRYCLYTHRHIFIYAYIYIGTHRDMQKQCIKEKELQANIMQLQASNSEHDKSVQQRGVLSRWCLQADPARNTDQPSWTGSSRPTGAHTGWTLLSSHQLRQLCACITRAKSFKEGLVEGQHGTCARWASSRGRRLPKAAWQVTWPRTTAVIRTLAEERLLSPSQHHARDDNNVKLSL